MKVLLLAALLPLICAAQGGARQETRYERVMEMIRNNSAPEDIPILKDNPEPLRLRMGLKLRTVNVDERKNMVRLTVVEQLQWIDEGLSNLTVSQSREDRYENVSIPRQLIWLPNISLASPAQESQLASPARALIDADGNIQYEPLYISYAPVNVSELHRGGAPVELEYKSTSYNAKDLLFRQPDDGSLDDSELKVAGYGVRDLKVEVRNPRPEERHAEKSRIYFRLRVIPLVQGPQGPQ